VKGTFSMKAQDQPAGLGHLGGIVFNCLPGLKRQSHISDRDVPLKHALDGMDAEEDFCHAHC